jgi:hypothetical protein
MVATSDRLVVAGVPFVAKRNSEEGISKSGRLEFTNPEEALKAFRGERGAFIHVVSGKDGSKISKHKLPAPPVHDGMSVANGKIFISLKNGAVLCLAGQ